MTDLASVLGPNPVPQTQPATSDQSRAEAVEGRLQTAQESKWLSRPRVLWAWALGFSFLLSIFAIFNGGYIGGDYNTHLARILNPNRFFDFSMGDPPIYDLIGHGLFRLIGKNNGFIITYSIIELVVNTVALWWFFLYTERRFRSPILHLAFVLFVTFLPARLIHVVAIGTDWMTIPVFVLLLFRFDKFLSEETSTLKNAALLGLVLTLGIWSKYNFMAFPPALFIIFLFLWWNRRWPLKRFVAICALSLVAPSALVLHDFWQSTRVPDAAAKTIWIPKGGAPSQPEYTYRDLLLLKKRDIELFSAPEFYIRKASDPYTFGFREAHRHSFLALEHMGVFTDTHNHFQELPGAQSIDRFLIPDYKVRRSGKTEIMVASMTLGTIWTLLALIGTPWILFGAIRHLWKDKLEHEDVALLLGTAFFLLMFLLIPFIYWSALTGSWQSRLYMISLLCFFLAGFLLLDRTVVAKWPKLAFDVLTLVIVQCGITVLMAA